MSDTMKIPRPLFCRRQNNFGGRTTLAVTGDAKVVKTRYSDDHEMPDLSLELVDTESDRKTNSSPE